MLRLKLQYFGHLVQRADSWKRPWCWERLKDKEKSSTGWDVRQHRQLNRHESEQWASVGLSLCCLPRPSHNLTTCNHQLPQQRHLQQTPKAKCVHTIGSGHRHCWPWSLGSRTGGTAENTNYHSSDNRPLQHLPNATQLSMLWMSAAWAKQPHALPDPVPPHASALGTLQDIPVFLYPEVKGFLYWNQDIESGRGDSFFKCAEIYKRIRHQEESRKQNPTKGIQ